MVNVKLIKIQTQGDEVDQYAKVASVTPKIRRSP